MFRRAIAGSVALLAFSADAAGQGSPSTISVIESLAVHAAVERAVGSVSSALRIVIDPMVVYANEAPGGRDSTRRDAERSALLIRAFAARELTRNSVIDCGVRPCRLLGADVLVSLSEPVISGRSAKVTVTTVQQTSRGIQYKTVNVLLELQRDVWMVVGLEDLGIS